MSKAGKALSWLERRTAHKWVNRMLEDPDRYRAAMSRWAMRSPAREAYYSNLLDTVAAATRSAKTLRPRPNNRTAPPHRSIDVRIATIIAPLLAVVIATSIGMHLRNGSEPQFMPSASARTVFRTKVGEVRTEQLADGSSILLDTDTVLTVDTKSQAPVIELQRGRARFTVSSSPAQKLRVRAGRFAVDPAGKVFDVSFRDNLTVLPIDGSVEVRKLDAGPTGTAAFLVSPGQILNIARGQGVAPSVKVARMSEQQWVDGMKSFDNVPIREIIAEANGYGERRLELADPSLGERRLFADINVRDIEMVAEAIAGFLDSDIDRTQANRLIITARK